MHIICPFIICKNKPILVEFAQKWSFLRSNELVAVALPLKNKQNEIKAKQKIQGKNELLTWTEHETKLNKLALKLHFY